MNWSQLLLQRGVWNRKTICDFTSVLSVDLNWGKLECSHHSSYSPRTGSWHCSVGHSRMMDSHCTLPLTLGEEPSNEVALEEQVSGALLGYG